MEVTAPVTDYIRASLLAVKGDIAKRGAAVVEKLAVGTAGQVLAVNSAADDLEYATPDIKAHEDVNHNVGQLTPGGAYVTIFTIDMGTLTAGDILLMNYIIRGRKGGTGGQTVLQWFKSSGTGTVKFGENRDYSEMQQELAANEWFSDVMTAIGHVTVGGTLVLGTRCSSGGSAFTIEASMGQGWATAIYKQ